MENAKARATAIAFAFSLALHTEWLNPMGYRPSSARDRPDSEDRPDTLAALKFSLQPGKFLSLDQQ